MTFTAFLLIFASVFLHAGWNFLSKKSSPSCAFYLIANGVGALACLGFALYSGIPWSALNGRFWTFYLCSNLFELFYFLGLAYGYKLGDISLVYPVGRALPVILTAAMAILFGLGQIPAPGALAGMGVIFVGCLLMPLPKFREFDFRVYCNKLLFFIILMAIGTTGYTIFDSLSMNELKTIPAPSDAWRSMFYIFMVELGVTVTLAVLVLLQPNERKEFVRLARSDSQPYWAGLFISAAYGLVLLAMCHVTNVSFVQAFRQMSLPVGVLAGIFFLKERCTAPKIVGTVLIVAGLAAVAYCR